MIDLAIPPAVAPPYISGGYVALFDGLGASAAYGVALDTLITLIPHTVKANLTINSLNLRTTTGAAGSAAKLALWASNPVTGRPTGLAIAGSNTGQSTATTSTNQTVAVSPSLLLRPGRYWYGVAITTLAPTLLGMSTVAHSVNSQFGRILLNGTVILGFTTPYAYANNILTLDLTGATLSDIAGAAGVPIMFVGTP